MSGFFIYLCSDDSKNIFKNNTYHDFTVQLPKYIHLNTPSCHLGWTEEWSVAITEISLNGLSLNRTLPSTVVVMCDVASHSFISDTERPVLRIIHANSEATTSLGQAYYVKVSQPVFNKIRIYISEIDLAPIDKEKWPKAGKLTCCLHFQRQG